MQWNLSCFSDIVLDEPLEGDKIRLPHDILSQYLENEEGQDPTLQSAELEFPITFKIIHNSKELIVSVLDFSGEVDTVVIPQWMMYNLYPLQMGDKVSISVHSGGYGGQTIPHGTYVKFRAHDSEFLEISNPRAVLEHILRNYGLLNKFSTLSFNYCDRQYNLDVIDTQPASVISIINTDIRVDFDAPADYIEPTIEPTMPPVPAPAPVSVPVSEQSLPAAPAPASPSSPSLPPAPPVPTRVSTDQSGVGMHEPSALSAENGDAANSNDANGANSNANTFIPFSGKGYRLTD